MAKEMLPVWYLPGPFTQYNEDVKALAKAARVRIIDATVTDDRREAADADQLPAVTLKDGSSPTIERACAEILARTAPAGEAITVAPGVQVTQAELEAKAIERLGLTPGKFKQLKKADREAAIVAELEALKAG